MCTLYTKHNVYDVHVSRDVRKVSSRLTRASVLAEARRALADGGLPALTMRNLADRLGVVPMALYRHVRNKDDLLDVLMDEAVARVVIPPADFSWREGLRTLAHSIRSAMIENREIASLVIARPNLGPNSIRIGEYGFGVLRQAGFPAEEVEPALNAVLTYTLGFVALEVPRTEGASGAASTSSVSLDRVYGTLDRSEFPNTFAVKPSPGALVSKDQFDFGLEALLQGIGLRQGGSSGEAHAGSRR